MRNLTATPGRQNSIVDIVDQLPKGKRYPWPSRSKEQVTHIIIHHMASEQPLTNQALYHINGRGWAALGYHIVIDRTRIVQTNDLLHVTNHASGYNERGIGIAILGDLSKRPMTDLERELLYTAILAVKAHWPNVKILGHNETGAKTVCPATSMDKIRADVEALEFQRQLSETPNAQLAEVVTAFARIQDVYSTATKPGKYQNYAIGLFKPIIKAMHDTKGWFPK